MADIADTSLHPDLCQHSFSSNLATVVAQMKGNMCVKIRGWEVCFFCCSFPNPPLSKMYCYILTKIRTFTGAELVWEDWKLTEMMDTEAISLVCVWSSYRCSSHTYWSHTGAKVSLKASSHLWPFVAMATWPETEGELREREVESAGDSCTPQLRTREWNVNPATVSWVFLWGRQTCWLSQQQTEPFSTQIYRIFWETKTLSDHLSLTVLFTINHKWGNKPEGKSNKTSATFSLLSSISVLPHNFRFVSIYS